MNALFGILWGGSNDSPHDDFDVAVPGEMSIAPLLSCEEFACYVALTSGPPADWTPNHQLEMGFGFWVNGEKVRPHVIESEEHDGVPVFFAWFKVPLKPGDMFRVKMKAFIHPPQNAASWN